MNYRLTRIACYISYIVGAVVCNFLPLLFVMFNTKYGVSYEELSLLIIINFVTQLATDVVSIKLFSRVGSRAMVMASNVLSCIGLILLALLPKVMSNTFLALCIAVIVFSVGGGLIEVMISPIIDRLPQPNSRGYMAFLHSFFCWGQIIVVLVTTVIIKLAGADSWPYISLMWAVIPFLNTFLLARVPIVEDVPEEERVPLKTLFSNKLFIVVVILMFAAGASELAMSQWASTFAEQGLGLPKMLGDILGPCAFALFMGVGRVSYPYIADRLGARKTLAACSALAVVCYLVAALSPNGIVSVLGCAMCGLGVSALWPGVYSLTSECFKTGGNAMFSTLAMAGDMGCSMGPWLVGMVAGGSGFKTAILIATAFPLISLIGLLFGQFNKE